MTRFNHQQRSGKRKRSKGRNRTSVGWGAAIRAHRELEYLRAAAGKSISRRRERARKLDEIERKGAK